MHSDVSNHISANSTSQNLEIFLIHYNYLAFGLGYVTILCMLLTCYKHGRVGLSLYFDRFICFYLLYLF